MSVGGSPDDEVDRILEDAGSRRSRILGGPGRGRPEGRRAVWIAVVSTVVFFTVLVIAIINAPGWLEVKDAFFNGEQFKESFPSIARAFLVNVKLFLIAEVFILVLAMFLAVMRSLPGPVFFPIRALTVGYIDLFRGIPTVLVIYTLGFGAPALGESVPKSPFFWAVVSLVLVYTAYVAEVYRAGIESVHESQSAAWIWHGCQKSPRASSIADAERKPSAISRYSAGESATAFRRRPRRERTRFAMCPSTQTSTPFPPSRISR